MLCVPHIFDLITITLHLPQLKMILLCSLQENSCTKLVELHVGLGRGGYIKTQLILLSLLR